MAHRLQKKRTVEVLMQLRRQSTLVSRRLHELAQRHVQRPVALVR